MERLLWLLIGYLCGSFQSGYFLGRAKGLDVRNYGSHSTGATNSLRIMGTGAGILVLLLDAAKAIIPCVLARHFFRGQAELQLLMVLWTATGVMLGHDYPFYLGFRGGKGVASTVGVLIALDWRLALAWCLLFIVTCYLFHYVSLSSILSMLLLLVLALVFFFRHALPVGAAFQTEFLLLALFNPLLSIFRHRANIGRLLRGEESQLHLFTRGMEVKK